MKYLQALMIMEKNNLMPQNRELKYGWNKIRAHSRRSETMEHFIGKAIVGKLIIQQGDGMITEHEFPNCQKADVIQLKMEDKSITAYQIHHTHKDPEIDVKNVGTIWIDINKAPQEVKTAFKTLENFFKGFIV